VWIIAYCAICGEKGPEATNIADFNRKMEEAGWRWALVRIGRNLERRYECSKCQVFLGDPDEDQP
jgi:hypothetical protein